MKFCVLLTVLLASKIKTDVDSVAANLVGNIMGNSGENSIVVKIEEDQYAKKKRKSSTYIGVYLNEKTGRWYVTRYSKKEKKNFCYGYHRDEEAAAHASDTLARRIIQNGERHELNFPDDNTEVHPEEKTTFSQYIGVSYLEKNKRWIAQRWGKTVNVRNGSYRDEKSAAHASDTLARKLMANGEGQKFKMNFPDDSTEMNPKTKGSKYFGVSYNEKNKTWVAQRWSRAEKKVVQNGSYRDEKTAAHASDTLARNLVANDDESPKLNFPEDNTEVRAKKKTKISKYLGVSYNEKYKKWTAQRWSKVGKKMSNNGGNHKDEETAARASDILARKLIANGEEHHKLNFPDDSNEEHPQQQNNKRKRSSDSENNLQK